MADDEEPIFKTIEPTQLQYQEIPIYNGITTKVYRGTYGNVPVAVKVMLTAEQTPFLRELRILHRLKRQKEERDPDNIVTLIGTIQYPEVNKIVTEFLPGGTLEELLDTNAGPLPLDRALGYALDIARAMESVHKLSIIHRDLNPQNILLTENQDRAVLIDFGLSREEDVTGMTVGVGSFRWMAPEVIRGSNGNGDERVPYDRKADVYSFSIVLWQLITNSTPYQGLETEEILQRVRNDTLRPIIEGVRIPLKLAMLLTSCWEPNPADRPEFPVIRATLEAILRGDYQNENDSGSDGPDEDTPEDDDKDGEASQTDQDKKKGKGSAILKICLYHPTVAETK